MSMISFIRCNRKDVNVPEEMTHKEIVEMNTRINTVIAYEFKINTLTDWRTAVKLGKIIHYFCYNEKGNKEFCEPKLPLNDSTIYKIQLAWNEVFDPVGTNYES